MEHLVLFFDFFGVICSEISPVWLEQYYDTQTAKAIKASVFPLADNGDLSEEETFRKLYEVTGIPVDRIKKEWDVLIQIDQELVAVIAALKSRYRIYLLSNAIASFLNGIMDRYALQPLFDKIFISSEMKKIKPHPDFFRYVLEDLGISGENALMIDDNPDNIRGAEEAGIPGVVYSDLPTLLEDLKSFGICTDQDEE